MGKAGQAERHPEEPVSDQRLGESKGVPGGGEGICVEEVGRRMDDRVPNPRDSPGLKLRVVCISQVCEEAGERLSGPGTRHDQTDDKIEEGGPARGVPRAIAPGGFRHRLPFSRIHSGIWIAAMGTAFAAFCPVAVFGVSGLAKGRGAPVGRSSRRTISLGGTAALYS